MIEFLGLQFDNLAGMIVCMAGFILTNTMGVGYIVHRFKEAAKVPQGKTVVGLRSDLLTQIRNEYEIHKVVKIGTDSHKYLRNLLKKFNYRIKEMPDIYIVLYKGKLSEKSFDSPAIFETKKEALEHIMEKVRYRYNYTDRLGRKRTIKQKTEKVWYNQEPSRSYSSRHNCPTPTSSSSSREIVTIKEYINTDNEFYYIRETAADDFNMSNLLVPIKETGRSVKAYCTYVSSITIKHQTYTHRPLRGDQVVDYTLGSYVYTLLED